MKNSSIIFFGFERGGSSIICRLLQLLLSSQGMSLVDIGGNAYNSGIMLSKVPKTTFDEIPDVDCFVAPFREYPKGLSLKKANNFRKVFLFRDPRAVLVSKYFAFSNIHTHFEEGKTLSEMKIGQQLPEINVYVLEQADELLSKYESYLKIISTSKTAIVYRYEDIFPDAVGWIKKAIHDLNIKPKSNAVTQCIIEAAFSRLSEDEHEFNRGGGIDGFREKLSIETLALLNKKFSEVLSLLDYPMERAITNASLVDEVMLNLRLEIDEIKRSILSLQTQNNYRVQEIQNVTKILKQFGSL